jgi:glycosyltransferase 2 family protein
MNHKTIILLLIGIGILALMVFFIGPAKIESALKNANPWYVALAVVIQFSIYGMWTQRWSLTIRSLHISIKKRHIFPMLMVGLAVNNITPSARGGGEPVRAYMLSKYSKTPMENAFATVIADRGLDTFPFVVLAILTIIFSVLYLTLPEWVVFALIISLVALVTVFIIILYMSINEAAGEKITLWMVKVVKRFSKKKHFEIERRAIEAMRGFQNSMRVMIRDRRVLMFGLPLSFFIWFMEITRVYIVFSSFGTPVPLQIIGAVFVIATLIGMIPLLPGGLGAVDGVMIILYSAAGVPPSISAAATIVERLISFWMTSFIGIGMLPYVGSGVMEKFSDKF